MAMARVEWVSYEMEPKLIAPEEKKTQQIITMTNYCSYFI